MEVIVAASAGFCFGVERAVNTVYSEVEKGEDIYTLGPIIHNDTVVRDLEKKGVTVIEDISDLADRRNGTVIIRSHGVSKQIAEALEKLPLNVIDATCPFVKKIHRIVEKESKEGRAYCSSEEFLQAYRGAQPDNERP